MTTKEQKKLLKALNTLDVFADEATRDNDNGEAKEQERAYNLLYNFINNHETQS